MASQLESRAAQMKRINNSGYDRKVDSNSLEGRYLLSSSADEGLLKTIKVVSFIWELNGQRWGRSPGLGFFTKILTASKRTAASESIQQAVRKAGLGLGFKADIRKVCVTASPGIHGWKVKLFYFLQLFLTFPL